MPAWLSVEALLLVLVGAVIAWLVLPPLLVIVYTSFHPARGVFFGEPTLDNYIRILTSSASLRVIGTTLSFAIPSAILTVCMSASLAWLAERTDAPFRSLAYIAAFSSLAIPAVIKAIAWVLVLGPTNGLVNAMLRGIFGPEAPVLSIFSLGGLVFFESISRQCRSPSCSWRRRSVRWTLRWRRRHILPGRRPCRPFSA